MIRLVQDNLNTHNASAFYQHLPAEEAFALAQKFEFVYTPKSASWLNMIEIEFLPLPDNVSIHASRQLRNFVPKSWLLSGNGMPNAP